MVVEREVPNKHPSRLARKALAPQDDGRARRDERQNGNKEHSMNIMNVDYSTKIPNNVNLSDDRPALKALEGCHPRYMNRSADMGPEGFPQSLVYMHSPYC